MRTCRIEPSALRSAEQWISERRASWERRLDRLGDFLVETDPRGRTVSGGIKRKSKLRRS